jgi:aerobic-type carbon monoxide dehydrogenase small subunit (CoxS/CutS family)
MKIQLHVNGAPRQVDVDPERSLLSVLRDELDLTGAKYGCGEGQCGACTVLIDGEMRRSCITPIQTAAGRRITTIESMEKNGQLHPLQQAFLDADALQCGYCTPGMIMAALGLLQKNPRASEAEILRHMEGSICRCGAHPRILKAIRAAAKQMQEARR